MTNHDCVIGICYDYDNTDLTTLDGLKKHIEKKREFNAYIDSIEWVERYYPHNYPFREKVWELKDYCDKRKATDLTRFDYCPYCGKKIEWKKIKEESK